MEDKLFDLLGLGVPFYLSAATYAVFAWLDSNASDEATKVISSWLHGHSQDKPDLGNLIISAFDRIYTSPLFSFRAFRRSAFISTMIFFLMILVPWFVGFAEIWDTPLLRQFRQTNIHYYSITIIEFSAFLFITILIDYISLLIVRKFLVLARCSPIGATIMSSVIGFIVLIVSFVSIIYVIVIGSFWIDYPSVQMPRLYSLFQAFKPVILQLFFLFMRPAFIIHLWLPLFALSSLVVKLIFWSFRAVEWAQWFLKQGDAHPLKAIGIVATTIVFGSAMLVKEGWALLSVLEHS